MLLGFDGPKRSYALLQLGVLGGQRYSYAALNILAASSVLLSLVPAFNLSSLIIQVSWIVISMIGIARLYLLTKMAKYSEEEEFAATQLPNLPRHLTKRLLNAGQWSEMPEGTVVTVEGAPIKRLVYLSKGQIKFSSAIRFWATALNPLSLVNCPSPKAVRRPRHLLL